MNSLAAGLAGPNQSHSVPAGMSRAKGYIKNVNTIEEFKNIDKNAMITDAGRQVRTLAFIIAVIV